VIIRTAQRAQSIFALALSLALAAALGSDRRGRVWKFVVRSFEVNFEIMVTPASIPELELG